MLLGPHAQTFIIIMLLIASIGITGVKASCLGVTNVPASLQPTAGKTPGAGPLITPAPAPHAELFKRDVLPSTCGYINGSSDSAITCSQGEWCQVRAVDKAFGCCSSPQHCTVIRTCVAYTPGLESATITGRHGTTYCTDSATPACAIGSYVGTAYPGFTWPFCWTATTLVSIFDDVTSTTTSSTSPTTPYPLPTTPPPPPPPPPPTTNVGAIVGGVVGGLAGLALLGLLGCFLFRRHKKKASTSSPQQPFVSQYYPPTVNQSIQGYSLNNDYTRHSSAATAPVDMTSRPGSAAYKYQPSGEGSTMSASPQPASSYGYDFNQAVEQGKATYEMPTERPERPPQEMPGSP